MTPEHRKVLEWITKDYESHTYWTELAKEVFLFSNGDSTLTRHRVADALRQSISRQPPGPAAIERWNKDFSDVISVEVEPPSIAVSSQLYVDWIRIADYVLLGAVSTFERLEEENQRRKESFERSKNGFETRQIVRRIKEYIEQHPGKSDDEIINALLTKKLEVKKAHLAIARKMAASQSEGPPIADEQEPAPPSTLSGYRSIYFP